MKRLLRYFNRLLPIFTTGLFLLSIAYLILVIVYGQGNERIIYWLAYFPPPLEREVTFSFIVTAPIGLGFIVGIRILTRRNPNIKRATQSIQTAIILALFAHLCLFTTYFVRSWEAAPFILAEHIDTVYTADHGYHLLLYYTGDSRNYSDPGEAYNRYLLYQCDSLDFLCLEIYSVFSTTCSIGISPDIEEISIVTDSDSNTVGFWVNGEIVYISQSG